VDPQDFDVPDRQSVFRIALDNASEAVYFTAEDGRIMYANQAACHSLGYRREEVTSLRVWDVDLRHTPERWAARWAELGARTEEPAGAAETELRRKDGTAFPVEVVARRIRLGQMEVSVAFVRDISQRRSREYALRKTQFSIDNAPEPIYWVRPDASISYVNEAACQALGYTREELLGMTIFELDPRFDAKVWPEHWEATRRRSIRVLETVHRRKDGTLLPVEIAIAFMQLGGEEFHCAFARDLSERRAAAEALREGEERLRLALYAANQGLYDLNVKTGETKVSPEYATMLGYDPTTFTETNAAWLDRLHPDDHERVSEAYRAYVAGDVPEYAVEFRQRTAGGDWRWILSLGRIVEYDADGAPVRMLGTHTDITRRREAELERETLQAQLLQAQRMEAVGQLAGGVAHDFNNMLSVILGYTELIQATVPEDAVIADDLEEIRKAARRARDTTSQLLAFSRRQVITPRPVDLNALIRRVHPTLARLLGEDVDVRFTPGPGLWRVALDATQFEQLLVNLAVNARDAMPDGGVLTIDTANVPGTTKPGSDPEEGSEPEDRVRIRVFDTGAGMSPEVAARAFEPFFTTKEVGKGTGLGLATVYGIVRQNEGSIQVESEPGAGACFTIFFPRTKAQPSDADLPVRAAGPSGQHRRRTILVVEDDPLVRRMVLGMLGSLGFDSVAAHAGDEALELCRDETGQFDLLLTDVVLPGMSGPELAEAVRSLRPDLEILFMSGYPESAIGRHGVLEDHVHFLPKPFELHQLSDMLRELLPD